MVRRREKRRGPEETDTSFSTQKYEVTLAKVTLPVQCYLIRSISCHLLKYPTLWVEVSTSSCTDTHDCKEPSGNSYRRAAVITSSRWKKEGRIKTVPSLPVWWATYNLCCLQWLKWHKQFPPLFRYSTPSWQWRHRLNAWLLLRKPLCIRCLLYTKVF